MKVEEGEGEGEGEEEEEVEVEVVMRLLAEGLMEGPVEGLMEGLMKGPVEGLEEGLHRVGLLLCLAVMMLKVGLQLWLVAEGLVEVHHQQCRTTNRKGSALSQMWRKE